MTDSRAHLVLIRMAPERIEETVAVLCDAFHDYPVMTHVIGDAGAEYDRRLRAMIHVFVSSRVLRGDPILGIEDEGGPVAIATLTRPGGPPIPDSIVALRESVWEILGPDAKARHGALVEVWERQIYPGLHYHLNMLGVRRSHAGRGLGGRLLKETHALSLADPESLGVSLSTEDPKNVPLYEHCGYKVVGYERVPNGPETWLFFRPDDAAGS